MSNAVADVGLVLNEMAALVEECSAMPVLKQQESISGNLLDEAGSKLNELRAIVENRATVVRKANVTILRAHAWRKIQPQLQALQEDIKPIKCSLEFLKGTSNSDRYDSNPCRP